MWHCMGLVLQWINKLILYDYTAIFSNSKASLIVGWLFTKHLQTFFPNIRTIPPILKAKYPTKVTRMSRLPHTGCVKKQTLHADFTRLRFFSSPLVGFWAKCLFIWTRSRTLTEPSLHSDGVFKTWQKSELTGVTLFDLQPQPHNNNHIKLNLICTKQS